MPRAINGVEARAGAPIFDFRSGWARVPGAHTAVAHWYDAGDGNALRSICGGHIVAITLPHEIGTFRRCLRCKRVLARKERTGQQEVNRRSLY